LLEDDVVDIEIGLEGGQLRLLAVGERELLVPGQLFGDGRIVGCDLGIDPRLLPDDCYAVAGRRRRATGCVGAHEDVVGDLTRLVDDGDVE
jgi:hypothetical protein